MICDKKLPHAIFLDIDGTLMAHGQYNNLRDGEIPKRNIEAIKRARAAGHKVIVNTGRGYFCFPECIKNSSCFDGFVTGLGALVIVSGKTIYNNPIKKEDIIELVTFLKANDKICRFQTSTGAFIFDNKKTQKYSDYWTRFDTAEGLFGLLSGGFVEKLTIDDDIKGEYLKFLQTRFNVVCYGDSGEATAKGNSKAGGVKIALEALGIPRERSIAMGDSLNDLDVLKFAGTSVATENGNPVVKEMCDMVTLSDVDGGVGYAIEKLLL